MKVDFSQSLLDITGDPIDGPDGRATLGGACINSLLTPVPSENPKGEEKLRRFHLSIQIQEAVKGGSSTVDLEAQDISYLKEILSKGHTALIYGQACDMLEGRPSRITKQPGANSLPEPNEE